MEQKIHEDIQIHDNNGKLDPEDAKETETGADNSNTGKKKERKSFTDILKIIYNLASSHIGLVILLILYTFIGAFIFQRIESPAETNVQLTNTSKDPGEEFLRNIGLSDDFNNTNKSWIVANLAKNASGIKNLIEVIKDEMEIYEKATAARKQGKANKWNFWGAVFYCGTVYTTVGYGHLAPSTDAGRIVTIFYAIIGIPLCLIVLADLGKLLARFFNYMWSLVCRIRKRCNRHNKNTAKKLKPESSPDIEKSKETRSEIHSSSHSVSSHGSMSSEGSPSDEEPIRIPLIIVIIIIILYVFIGAAVYRLWEDWSFTEACYFIFISIFTIGFGDIIPNHPHFFLISSIYIFIGMAFISMALNIIGQMIAENLKNAARKIKGTVKKTIQAQRPPTIQQVMLQNMSELKTYGRSSENIGTNI